MTATAYPIDDRTSVSLDTGLHALLACYREHARSPRELGDYFESLVIAYFTYDDVQKQYFDRVLRYADWVRERGEDASAADTGIDLVAHLKGTEDEWCAIQCKFRDPDYRIQRSDIDSFFTASGRRPFTLMPCGTGKTFVALKVAEACAGAGGVLFMVPSLALMDRALNALSSGVSDEQNSCADLAHQ